jgi:DNA polymerase I
MSSIVSDPLRRVLDCLGGVEERNGYFAALCPAHIDHNPSLHIKEIGENDNRKVLLTCHAGCDTEKVLKGAGLKWEDLFVKNGAYPSGRSIVAAYDYTSPTGELLHQTVRYEPKDFSQRRPDGDGGWIWSLKDIEPVLYNRRGVMHAVLAGETIYVLEGEKDCDRAREELGITATTCAMGAEKWRDSYTHTLAGANVILIPDNDEAGRKHVLKVAEELDGVARSVKLLELPDLPEKGDLSDWLDAGGTKEEFEYLSSSSQPPIPSGDGDDVFGAVRFVDLGDPEPRRFVVEDLLPETYPCLLHGGGGSAKSIVAALLGISISSGNLKEFLDRRIFRHGPALIIDFELEVDEQNRRVRALCAGLGIEVPENLYYLSGLGMNTREVFERAAKICEKLGVVFAVIDSIGFAMHGDMESSKDVNAFFTVYVDPLRAVGVTPMIIDHQGKLQSGESYQRKTAFGSAFKEHRARSILQVEAVENDRDGGILKVRLRHKKANFSARIEPFDVELRFAPGRIVVTTVELSASENASEETLSATERIRLALKDGEKTTSELSEFTGLSREYLWNILPTLERERTVRVVKTEGRTKTYGLSEPPDGGGKPPKKKEKPTRRSEGSNVVSFPGSPTVSTPENLSSPSQSLYRDEDGDDVKEGGAEPYSDSLSGRHHPHLITSEKDLKALVRYIASEATEAAIDLETCPPGKALDPRNGSIRLISVAVEGMNKAVDVSKVHPGSLLDVLKTKTLVFFNAKFDLSFLKSTFGYEHEGEVKDVMLMHLVHYFAQGERVEKKGRKFLEDPDETKGISDLAYVTKLYLSETLDKSEQDSDWSVSDLSEVQIDYALKDTEILVRLKETLEERLSELGLLQVADIEHRALLGVAWAENNGMPFDKHAWLRLAEENAKEAKRLKEEIDHYATPHPEEGKAWNWNSGHQIVEALELLGFKTSKLPKTDSGKPSTSESALKSVKSPKEATELAQAILRYRSVQKLSSTYGEKWTKPAKATDPERVSGDRVHTSFRQMVSTGRMASRKPNLQNLPKDDRFRKAFKALAGRRVVVADYAQIELWLGAIVAGDEHMLMALKKGEDLHLKTARALIRDREVSEAELREYRKRAKIVNFGFLYGMGAKRFVDYAKDKFGLEVRLGEAKRYREAFFKTYPGIAEWHRRVGEACNRGEDVAFTLLGRPRKLGLQRSRYTGAYEPVFTEATNHPVQGSGADALKLTIARLWETRNECAGNPLLVGIVHDEIIVEVDEGNCEEATDWLIRCMYEAVKEVAGDPDTPVVVEVETKKSWGR